jgi:hypothetical protein
MTELEDETTWIFNRFIDDKLRPDTSAFLASPIAVKSKILKVLQLLRCEMLDVPMITMYRKYEFQKELDENDIWTLFNLD